MRIVAGGATARFDLEVFDSSNAAVTGLVTGNFTKRLTTDGVNDATAVTVTEVGNGRYTVTFAAPAVTSGNVKYTRCWVLHSTYAPRGWAEDFEVYNATVLAGVLQTADINTVAQRNKIADHVLRRALTNARASSDGDAVVFRSLLGALAKLVNKIAISGSTLSIYDETDTGTPVGTQTVSTSAGADPVTGLDTV